METTQKVIAGRRVTIPHAVAEVMDIEVGDVITVTIKGVERSKNRKRGK